MTAPRSVLILAVTLGLLAASLASQTQEAEKMRRVGHLSLISAERDTGWAAAFRQGL